MVIKLNIYKKSYAQIYENMENFNSEFQKDKMEILELNDTISEIQNS